MSPLQTHDMLDRFPLKYWRGKSGSPAPSGDAALIDDTITSPVQGDPSVGEVEPRREQLDVQRIGGRGLAGGVAHGAAFAKCWCSERGNVKPSAMSIASKPRLFPGPGPGHNIRIGLKVRPDAKLLRLPHR